MLMLVLEPVHAALRAVLDPALVAALGPGTSSQLDASDRLRTFLAAVHGWVHHRHAPAPTP
jgi:hypothetical protein